MNVHCTGHPCSLPFRQEWPSPCSLVLPEQSNICLRMTTIEDRQCCFDDLGHLNSVLDFELLEVDKLGPLDQTSHSIKVVKRPAFLARNASF